MSLEEYRRKRRAEATPEPVPAEDPATRPAPAAGSRARPGGRGRPAAPIFVVHRHDATRLHYDLRLERDGALASWAVPKGVPLEPGEQHLAVHVEDHPLEYATFHGTIPKGQYGAGTVEIWDEGTWELVEEKPDGGLTFRLHGKRLEGTWALVPAHLSGDERNWLLLRKREEGSARAANPDGATRSAPSSTRTPVRPMLASLAGGVPRGDGWLYEVKWDGYRAIGSVRGGEAALTSRNGNDLTGRFPDVAKALVAAARSPDCVVDGEVVALDAQGRPSFSAMQQGTGTLVYELFDLLELDGRSLLQLPLAERRDRLRELVVPGHPVVRLSEAFDDGEALLAAAAAQGLEGIVAKRADSTYTPGRRARTWLKVKARGRQELVVCGWTEGQGRRAGTLGALVLGVWEDESAGSGAPPGLRWAGNVGTGFDDATIQAVLARLRPLERPDPPFAGGAAPRMARVRKADVHWVEPRLLAEVEFAEWTHEGRLRAPSFLGLRDDKPAREVRRERPLDAPAATPAPVTASPPRDLRLTNLDKVFWPGEGITKGDLVAYYRDVAPVLVPHLRDRPFTMKRYPDGRQAPFFFQKDAPKHMPPWIPTARVTVHQRDRARTPREIDVPLVNDADALVWMANAGCIDMNAWYSRVDKPDRPDFVLFDLDPSDDVGFDEAVQVALIVREALAALGLECWAKTSGSEGMHVLVPLERRHTYDETRAFSELVARAVASAQPGLATTEWSKAKRRGVLIDANQNGRGKTIASVYSVRPKEGAPVSTPLAWDEVAPGLDPARFTMDEVLARVRRHGDLFEPVLRVKQRLGPALRALGG